MAGMMAVILLLNGVQVELPAPALLLHDTACVPLRAVCERQGAPVMLEPDGHAVVAYTHTGPVRFPLAAQLPSSPPKTAFSLRGITYVPARALAEALGGHCHWNARARTVSLDLPWLSGTAQPGSPEALVGNAAAWRCRPVMMQARHPGGAIDWVAQDFAHDLARIPLSGRGRPLRITGHVRLDSRAAPVIEPADIAADPSHPSLSVIVAPGELTPGDTGLVTVKMSNHTASWMDLGHWPPLRVRLEGPAGQAIGIALGEGPAGLGGAGGLEPRSEVSWNVPWQVPEGHGREHVGVWRARVRTPAGIERAEFRFTVRPPAPPTATGEAE